MRNEGDRRRAPALTVGAAKIARSSVVRVRVAFVALLALAGCTESHEVDGGLEARDAGAGRDAGSDAMAQDAGPVDAGVPMPPPDAIVCGGVVCAAGEACCLLTLECFDETDPAACAVPAGEPEGACASGLDCADEEVCLASHPDEADVRRCGGVGRCVPIPEPAACGPGNQVCGCDGRTYDNRCEAARAGVRVSSVADACGRGPQQVGAYLCMSDDDCPARSSCDLALMSCVVDEPLVACGIDEQCWPGSRCCGSVGICIAEARSELCFLPPPGTELPCFTNDDCLRYLDLGDRADDVVCLGSGCGTPGGCARRPNDCGGVLAEVCGCDGLTYTNECWAGSGGTRVAHDGACE
jgi:hypothetical protein